MRTLLVALILLGVPALAFAQPGAGPPDTVQMRLGPLYVNPTIALSNAGTDTNVFNSETNPQSDFTMTITPATDIWLRFGPTWFQTTMKEDIVWFNKFASERSANNGYNLTWTVPLSRFTFVPKWTYLNTRDRPGFEIDARSQRTEVGYSMSADVRLFLKTSIGVEASRNTTTFDKAAVFLGTNLSDELDRKVTTETVNLTHKLTPLTTISLSVSKEQDRFDIDHLRDADSTSISGSIKFDPAALIKGGASFGYRNFSPASPDLPGYQGTTAAVDLSYVLFGTTKFSGTLGRDVQYSYDVNQPYYVQTGGTVSVSQQIFGPFDVVVRGGLQRLDYQDRTGAIVAVTNRVDHTQTFGGGVGYHVGRGTRIGFNLDQQRRLSGVDLHQYKGLTYGFSVTYGS